jgi:hypothetical protein
MGSFRVGTRCGPKSGRADVRPNSDAKLEVQIVNSRVASTLLTDLQRLYCELAHEDREAVRGMLLELRETAQSDNKG